MSTASASRTATGDRRSSGHSVIGVAVFEHAGLRAEAVGRWWSRGRMLAWLAEP
jgi:hypothetical protein